MLCSLLGISLTQYIKKREPHQDIYLDGVLALYLQIYAPIGLSLYIAEGQ